MELRRRHDQRRRRPGRGLSRPGLRAVAGRRPQARRLLAEAEDHLRDATDGGLAEGLPPVDRKKWSPGRV